jgi:hypothetical protein
VLIRETSTDTRIIATARPREGKDHLAPADKADSTANLWAISLAWHDPRCSLRPRADEGDQGRRDRPYPPQPNAALRQGGRLRRGLWRGVSRRRSSAWRQDRAGCVCDGCRGASRAHKTRDRRGSPLTALRRTFIAPLDRGDIRISSRRWMMPAPLDRGDIRISSRRWMMPSYQRSSFVELRRGSAAAPG